MDAFTTVMQIYKHEEVTDGDLRVAVYRELELNDNERFIAQYIVDGVVEELMRILGKAIFLQKSIPGRVVTIYLLFHD